MSALELSQSSAVSTTYDVHEEFKAENHIQQNIERVRWQRSEHDVFRGERDT